MATESPEASRDTPPAGESPAIGSVVLPPPGTPNGSLTLPQIRQALQISQTTLARTAGLARSTLSGIENGRVLPHVGSQTKIVAALHALGWRGRATQIHWATPLARDPAWGGAARPTATAKQRAAERAAREAKAHAAAEQRAADRAAERAATAKAERETAWATARRQWKQKDHQERLRQLEMERTVQAAAQWRGKQ